LSKYGKTVAFAVRRILNSGGFHHKTNRVAAGRFAKVPITLCSWQQFFAVRSHTIPFSELSVLNWRKECIALPVHTSEDLFKIAVEEIRHFAWTKIQNGPTSQKTTHPSGLH
jgi:hypothetical protein